MKPWLTSLNSGSSVGVGNTVGTGSVLLSEETVALLLTLSSWTIDIVNVKTEISWVDVAVSEDEEETETWLGENIEDTVEDGLRIWVDDVTSL